MAGQGGQHYPMASMSSQMMSNQATTGGYSQTQSSGSNLPHQQSFPSTMPSSTPQPPQMMSPTRSVNSVSLCKLGQETNQELVNKLLDVFKQFKTLQLPNGTNNTVYQERRMKMEESLRQLNIYCRKLRVIYDKVSEQIIEPDNAEEVLVPFKGDVVEEKNINTDAYKFVAEEHCQIVEQIQQKNLQIKEVIDQIRTIMWEINTMIVMRKT